MKKNDFFARYFCLAIAFACAAPMIFAQTNSGFNEDGNLFTSHLKVDRKALDDNPQFGKAFKEWETKIDDITAAYVEKLEKTLDREKPKGDLNFLKGLEIAILTAKEQHRQPCLLFDRLPPKLGTVLGDLNKAKSRVNKEYFDVIQKEIATVLRNKELEKAKDLDGLIYSSFTPASMETQVSLMYRFENKIFLFVADRKNWQDARQWCRERNGDLASVSSQSVQQAMMIALRKQGSERSTFCGGARTERGWQWSDGTPFTYKNWAPGEPSGGGQNRIAFAFKNGSQWDDVSANSRYPFMIQWTLY